MLFIFILSLFNFQLILGLLNFFFSLFHLFFCLLFLFKLLLYIVRLRFTTTFFLYFLRGILTISRSGYSCIVSLVYCLYCFLFFILRIITLAFFTFWLHNHISGLTIKNSCTSIFNSNALFSIITLFTFFSLFCTTFSNYLRFFSEKLLWFCSFNIDLSIYFLESCHWINWTTLFIRCLEKFIACWFNM